MSGRLPVVVPTPMLFAPVITVFVAYVLIGFSSRGGHTGSAMAVACFFVGAIALVVSAFSALVRFQHLASGSSPGTMSTYG